MKHQRIPKYLPVKVGHKIGDLDDYRHDIAIIYAKESYILAVMTQNYITYEQISILSKEIYDILK
ncbi:class A beta-lactamase-related serine hydrolase [Vagococcus sp. PNs007]|uniref:Class A beta-lactamase-related serine hydrolase n=1 Tax=Vagococcus proximus TaxID=2991417 RepID=A0ABT5X3X7_9ENTE|nr:serine hydrolase [Vagococcus proximus]MDF0480699.1 class A beta-lactamase-related serine hydrolase [Vagococcus proximus]